MGKKHKLFLSAVFIWFFSSLPALALDNNRVVELSLKDVSRLALKNNLDIQIVKLDYYISRCNLDKTKSIFDSLLKMSAEYTKDKSAKNSVFSGNEEKIRGYNLDLTKKLPTGTALGLRAGYKREKTDSSYVLYNPSLESSASVSITQELGRNFFGILDRNRVKITQLDVKNSELSSLSSIELYLAEIQKAYWLLALAYKKLEISRGVFREAEKLYNIYKNKLKTGLVEEPDLLAAQANMNLRKSGVLDALMALANTKRNLLFLLNEPDINIDIKVKDDLGKNIGFVNLFDCLNTAVKFRRDYQQAKRDVEINRIFLKMKRNSLWPQIDLKASFAKNGISSDYKDSWQAVSSEGNSYFSVGLKLVFPLENRRAKAEYSQQKLKKAQSLLMLKKTEKQVFLDINNQVMYINTLVNRINTQRNIVNLQKRKLEAEKKRLKYGRSSSDIIIRYEDDLLNSKLLLVNLLYDYQCALIDLEVKENSLLKRYWRGAL